MIQNMVSREKELWALRKVEEELIDVGYLRVTTPQQLIQDAVQSADQSRPKSTGNCLLDQMILDEFLR